MAGMVCLCSPLRRQCKKRYIGYAEAPVGGRGCAAGSICHPVDSSGHALDCLRLSRGLFPSISHAAARRSSGSCSYVGNAVAASTVSIRVSTWPSGRALSGLRGAQYSCVLSILHGLRRCTGQSRTALAGMMDQIYRLDPGSSAEVVLAARTSVSTHRIDSIYGTSVTL
ncbi:hypothetical protein BDW22DRAFT_351704 [Trametopsis cervina]|nr:hypothetical protein BDW22DRAFT_351704 [Trametopsis cervina]